LIDTVVVEQKALLPSPLADDMAVFRRFNRIYTRFIGTLHEGLLETKYSLAEARVLYEIASRSEPTAKEIAEELSIDPGYLSRLLTKFERGALLKRKVSEQDSRFAELSLTSRGKSAFKKLNALSDKQARAVLEPLQHSVRAQLIHAIRSIEAILTKTGEPRPPFILRPHRVGDMGWVVCRESAVYAEEYGWDETFEALVARIVAGFLENFDAKRERCWIADVDGQGVGHIFLVKHPDKPDVAKLRLLFVEPGARGMGLGRALVNECIRFARTDGYRKIVLWTQSILVAAHRIYEKAGFQLVKEEPHHSFGKNLVGQTWELELV
jgi:DNA-binding MarR family transcriptional regulator/GNAT superfamily N-acetyltransferase